MAYSVKGVKPCSDRAKHDWKDETGDVGKCGGK